MTCNRADDGNFVAFKRPHSNSAVRGDLSTVKSACTELAPCHTRAANVLKGLVIFLEYSRHGMCYLVCADGRARPDKNPIQVMQRLSAATVCHTVVRVAYTISLSGHLRSRRIQQNLLQHLNMPQGCNKGDTPAETTESQIGVFVCRVRKGRSLCDVHNAIYVCVCVLSLIHI